MNPISHERFCELAMKSVACQCNPEETAELQSALAQDPELASELAQLHAQAAATKDLLALVQATESEAGSIPEQHRERLRQKVNATYGASKNPAKPKAPPPTIEVSAEDQTRSERGHARRKWKKYIGLLSVALLLLYFLWPGLRYDIAIIKSSFALDWSRKAAFQRAAKSSLSSVSIKEFKPDSRELKEWENTGSARTVKVKCFVNGKVIPTLDSIEVFGRWGDRTFQRTFPVSGTNWNVVLSEVKAFVKSPR